MGKTVLIFEGGEINRFDDNIISYGVEGILRVLNYLNMIAKGFQIYEGNTLVSRKSSWYRARKADIALLKTSLGEYVKKGQLLGQINDSLGIRLGRIYAHREGIVIGKSIHPLLNQGDAVYHIAEVE